MARNSRTGSGGMMGLGGRALNTAAPNRFWPTALKAVTSPALTAVANCVPAPTQPATKAAASASPPSHHRRNRNVCLHGITSSFLILGCPPLELAACDAKISPALHRGLSSVWFRSCACQWNDNTKEKGAVPNGAYFTGVLPKEALIKSVRGELLRLRSGQASRTMNGQIA